MIKVVIADDEKRVCDLIQFLVDWDSLGMEVVFVAYNGIQALEAIEKYRPDVVITDIRMPGYSGLEMIERAKSLVPDMEIVIISGYSRFEYAKEAIKFGVREYLLKPIRQEELAGALARISAEYRQRQKRLSDDEKLRSFERKDLARTRSALFEEVLFQKRLERQELTIENLNNLYQFHFGDGLFQVVVLKIDGFHEGKGKDLEFAEEKVRKLLPEFLGSECIDMEYFLERGMFYIFLNFTRDKQSLRRQLKALLAELLLQKDILKELDITIGAGEILDSPERIRESFKSALWSVEQRLIEGTHRVIESRGEYTSNLADSELFHNFNRNFIQVLECQDLDGVRREIQELRDALLSDRKVTGHEILQMSKEVMNLYSLTMTKGQFPTEHLEELFDDFNQGIHSYGSVKEIFDYLETMLCRSFIKMMEDKKQADSRPIREAKKYIQENFAGPITLEKVSEVVGFNPAYFSGLFKQETGTTFTEYLLKLRMEQAKTLLKETKLSVSSICTQVGYSDTKHFTKSFTKYTSLKPNEYRKLYS
ncbi:MAG: response regulator [Eubacteriales bacterium]|nr:response regulator [Eubacteriales bacterium]